MRETNDDGSPSTTWAQVVAQSNQTATSPQEPSSSKGYDIEHGCDVGEYCKVLEKFSKFIGAASTEKKRSNRMQLYRRLIKRLKYANNNPGKKKREQLADQFRANRDNDRKILRRFAKWADKKTSASVGRRDAIATCSRACARPSAPAVADGPKHRIRAWPIGTRPGDAAVPTVHRPCTDRRLGDCCRHA